MYYLSAFTMGIPSYFSYIIKNYSNIIRNLYSLKADGTIFHHLYMDCNSIIYDSVRTIEKMHDTAATGSLEDKIIDIVIDKIDGYIDIIQPTKTVYIAFDGVAPFAKMDQQRSRRYKGSFSGSGSNSWTTSNITPGTQFMTKLADRVNEFYTNPKNRCKYITEKIIVSASDECGEGEHKMFRYIRQQKMGVNSNETAAVYGLDSDLIMLSIFHCSLFQNLFIFREAPEFMNVCAPLQSVDNPKNADRLEYYFMDILNLSNAILMEMSPSYSSIGDRHRIYDYIFLCFFLGNDFLPHFPALNIRTTGIDILLNTYRSNIGKYGDRYLISPKMEIQWKWVTLFVKELANKQHEYILAEYNTRTKWKKHRWSLESDKDCDFTLQSIPVIYCAEETYINPREKGWENRYYKSLFHETSHENASTVAINYLEGLEWVFKYYTMDCPDWKWKYNYHYPPLLCDLYAQVSNHAKMNTSFFSENTHLICTSPFHPIVQLIYVLPPSAQHLLPPNVQKYIDTEYKQLFPQTFEFQWAFCRYFWESHIILPEIPLSLLEKWNLIIDQ